MVRSLGETEAQVAKQNIRNMLASPQACSSRKERCNYKGLSWALTLGLSGPKL